MFVSYAQNFEDVMLWRAFRDVEQGFYVDLGAQDPLVDSVSLAFSRTRLAGRPCRAFTVLRGSVCVGIAQTMSSSRRQSEMARQ
jgi:hypothetical protein